MRTVVCFGGSSMALLFIYFIFVIYTSRENIKNAYSVERERLSKGHLGIQLQSVSLGIVDVISHCAPSLSKSL